MLFSAILRNFGLLGTAELVVEIPATDLETSSIAARNEMNRPAASRHDFRPLEPGSADQGKMKSCRSPLKYRLHFGRRPSVNEGVNCVISQREVSRVDGYGPRPHCWMVLPAKVERRKFVYLWNHLIKVPKCRVRYTA